MWTTFWFTWQGPITQTHIGLAGGVHSGTGVELTHTFTAPVTYQIEFQPKSYMFEKLEYSLQAGGIFRLAGTNILLSQNSSQQTSAPTGAG